MATAKEVIQKALQSDGIKYQILSSCVQSAEVRKGVTQVKFGTTCADVVDVVDNRKMVGVILWIPRDVYDEEVNK